MRAARRIVLTLLGLILLGARVAWAGGLDCNSRWLDRTGLIICDDPELTRLEEQLARRLDSLATRLNFGQYLGLRHWQAMWAGQRATCAADLDCITGSYRAQGRFLDRFQKCINASLARRACLRDLLDGERETMRH
ncbi:MAG: hypothetical protein J2P50_07055 [Hyphomicrobiaceae bacterium]|nr:hypothetical protein [Hyphomicrobiaceae bacterium]